jgi:hypothetical protein
VRENVRRLIVTLDPRDSCWELYTGGAPGTRALLGWVTDPKTVDAGVPQAVAMLLARALCRCVMLTFLWQPHEGPPASEQWRPLGKGQVKHLKAGLLERVRGNPPFTLLATCDPADAENLFYNEKFSWELRAQRVFLSPIEALPDLDYRHVSTVFNWPPKLDVMGHFQGTNVLGMLLPGVDGDFAELVVFDEGQRPALQQALSQECAARGVDFQLVDEATFKQTKWFTDSP